ncbi:MAG: hypothetical protein A2114_01780 [Candidatus Vogelbacteria bacterium GWA1_51_14]|uniref:Uncharacterized protein n=1 Tax=Candidatus Vogelbacteria bacterium GWA1_51_14 TaxID=1802435 RepID=A0A1G2Q803_9BACT|nr:MAG: hypothetical protein A2114_01780 [Candidatus Vogelbacteria bacterium GWA1_51_14]
MAAIQDNQIYRWLTSSSLTVKERNMAKMRNQQEKAMREFRYKRSCLSPAGKCDYLSRVMTSDWAEVLRGVDISKLGTKTLRFVEALCRGRVRSYSSEEKAEARRMLQQIEAEIQGRKAA